MILTMMVGDFIEVLDENVLNTAIYKLHHILHAPLSQIQLAISLYMVGLSIVTPISIPFVNAYGVKKAFIFAYSVFILGTLCCALSTDIIHLTLARVLQSIGAAFMLPVTRIALRKYFRATLFQFAATFACLSLLGFCLGPILAGFVLSWGSWRYLFILTIPPLLVCLMLCFKSFATEAKKPFVFESQGFCFYVIPIVSLSVFFIYQNIMSLLLALCVSFYCLIAYKNYTIQKKGQAFIPLEVFINNQYIMFLKSAFFFRIALSSILFLIPIFFQIKFDFTVLKSSLLVVFYGLGAIFGRLTIFVIKLSCHKMYLFLIFVFIGFLQMAFFSSQKSFDIAQTVMLIAGFFCSRLNVFLNTNALNSIKKDFIASSSVLLSSVLQISGGIGVAISTMITLNIYFSIFFILIWFGFWTFLSFFTLKPHLIEHR